MRTAATLRRTIAPTAVFTAVTLVLVGCSGGGSGGGGEAEEAVTLSVAHTNTPDHFNGLAMQQWMDEVTEATDGSVEFEPFWTGSLCPAAEIAACVTSGVADIGFTSPTYNPANHPIATIADIGFVTKDLHAYELALNEMYENSPDMQSEYEALNQRLLYFEPFAVPGLASKTGGIEELDDLAGQKIRANGSWVSALERLGAVPLTVDWNEIYESVQRGVIDGANVPAPAVSDMGLDDVVTHYYDLGAYLGATTTMQVVMNQDKWGQLSESQKNAIDDVTASTMETKVANFMAKASEEACATFDEAGIEVVELKPSDDTEEWVESVGAEQRAAWAATSGLEDPDAFLEEYLSLIAKYTTPEFDKTTIDYCG